MSLMLGMMDTHPLTSLHHSVAESTLVCAPLEQQARDLDTTMDIHQGHDPF
jgi:hypothetical protein